MGYKNGKDYLPEELLKELQKYIQGEIIYIPRMGNERRSWGENNGTKVAISDRNDEIYYKYKQGVSIENLMAIYNLCEESIRKIIFKVNRKIGGIQINGIKTTRME